MQYLIYYIPIFKKMKTKWKNIISIQIFHNFFTFFSIFHLLYLVSFTTSVEFAQADVDRTEIVTLQYNLVLLHGLGYIILFYL